MSCLLRLRAVLSAIRPQFRQLGRQAGLLAVAGCGVFSMTAKADTIVVGVLSFDNIIPAGNGVPGTNGFTIYNFTGANAQPGTPDTAISFLNTSVLLNHAQSTDAGVVTPGSVQPAALQFPSDQSFTDAQLSATLSTTMFDISGTAYVAASDVLTAELTPATPPDLVAGSDFVLLSITASKAGAAAPEPGAFWLTLGSAAALALVCARKRS